MASFYVCRVCAARVAVSDDFEYCFTLRGMTGGVFQNLSNVHMDDPKNYRMIGDHAVTNVHCNTCRSLLGFRFIEVPNYEGGPSKEDFLIHLRSVLMFDGCHFLDAQTEEELTTVADSDTDTPGFLNYYQKMDQKNQLKVPISLVH